MNCPVEFSNGNSDRSTIKMAYVLLLSESFSLQHRRIVEIKYLKGYKCHLSRMKWKKLLFQKFILMSFIKVIIGTIL